MKLPTRREIDAEPAGPLMDAWVHAALGRPPGVVPPYSTDPPAAVDALESMAAKDAGGRLPVFARFGDVAVNFRNGDITLPLGGDRAAFPLVVSRGLLVSRIGGPTP